MCSTTMLSPPLLVINTSSAAAFLFGLRIRAAVPEVTNDLDLDYLTLAGHCSSEPPISESYRSRIEVARRDSHRRRDLPAEVVHLAGWTTNPRALTVSSRLSGRAFRLLASLVFRTATPFGLTPAALPIQFPPFLRLLGQVLRPRVSAAGLRAAAFFEVNVNLPPWLFFLPPQ